VNAKRINSKAYRRDNFNSSREKEAVGTHGAVELRGSAKKPDWPMYEMQKATCLAMSNQEKGNYSITGGAWRNLFEPSQRATFHERC